ncbi:MAG: tripartite tricarboxylate transporter TctB family protein [Rhodospirillales bacterium]|nr:tripartite tricarboxylate transporter TctB family protein [Rhodospirillales bacterium]
MESDRDTPSGDALVSVRTMEIVVTLLFIAAGTVVIIDSLRLGIGWNEHEGPASGYFPFYIGVIMMLASAGILIRTLLARESGSESFVGVHAARQVVLVLVPLLAYVGVTALIGFYVASAIYIALFMRYFGRYGWTLNVPVATGVVALLFFTFERWFLVPLPKGPIEAYFGY